MTLPWIIIAVLALALLLLVAGAFLALAMGRMHLDLGWGRSRHELGPLLVRFEAPRELVFEMLSAPYMGRARSDSIELLNRDERLVVAAHLTKVHFYTARTVEAVELEPPERMGFRHLTGPVPYAVEEFRLEADGEATNLHYEGELGIDYFWLGRIAARRWVLPQWNATVSKHLEDVRPQAEKRAARARERASEEGASEASAS